MSTISNISEPGNALASGSRQGAPDINNPNGGLCLLEKSTIIIGIISADQKRRALVGSPPDQVKELVQFGMHIVINGYPERPEDVERAVLTEISARLTNGLDSVVAGQSLLALVLLHLEITGQMAETLRAAQTGGIAFQLGRNASDTATITPTSPPEGVSNFLDADGSVMHTWAGEAQSRSDLTVYVEDVERGIDQSLVIPRLKARSLIRKAEREFAKILPHARQSYVMAATLATIRFYHQSLEGDMVAMPASKWDWRSARALLAGRIAWLLRERGLLEKALSCAAHGDLHVSCSGNEWTFELDDQGWEPVGGDVGRASH